MRMATSKDIVKGEHFYMCNFENLKTYKMKEFPQLFWIFAAKIQNNPKTIYFW